MHLKLQEVLFYICSDHVGEHEKSYVIPTRGFNHGVEEQDMVGFPFYFGKTYGFPKLKTFCVFIESVF